MKKIFSLIMIMLVIFGVIPMSYAVPSPAANATITITTDDAYDLYVNGISVGSGTSWAVVDNHRVYLAGNYTIAVKGMDKANVIAGLTVTITFDDKDTAVTTNSGWVYSLTEVTNWNKPGFDDSLWTSVFPVTPHANWPKDLSWIWSKNYLASNAVFDRTVYFRYDGYKDLPDVINISPIFEGYVDNGDGDYTAFFGFENNSHDGLGNPIDVTLPFNGSDNYITGEIGTTNFPSSFNYPNVVLGRPGRTPFFPNAAIRVDNWDGSNIVWNLNGKTATAGLSGQQHKPTIEVKPIFEGWVDNGDGTYKAYFGFLNNSKDAYGNPMAVNIPFGSNDNKVTGFTGSATFPSDFSTGRTPYFPNAAIVIDGWDGSNIVWKIFTRTATASLAEDLEKDLDDPTEDPGEEEEEEPTPTIPTTPTPTPTEPAAPVGPQSNVTINYIDGNNAPLSSPFTFSGSVGSNYSTSPITINGFTLVEMPANASGSFVDGGVVINYVYTDGTVVVEDEDLALGASGFNFDANLSDEETTEAVEEDVVEAEVILDEATPLADALPQTGQVAPEWFFGIGSLITAAGITLKKRIK